MKTPRVFLRPRSGAVNVIRRFNADTVLSRRVATVESADPSSVADATPNLNAR